MSARPFTRTAKGALIATALLLAAACGQSVAGAGGGGPQTGEGLPPEVRVVNTNPLSGPVALVGEYANRGYDLALHEINSSNYLGDTKITMKKLDTAGEAQTAASQTTQAVANEKASVLIGSVLSSDAVAQAPIAQKAKTPIVFTQAGSEGVVIGDYTYRMTPLMSEYFPVIKSFIRQQGWKSLGIIYTVSTPTLQEIGEKTLPAIAKDLGMEVTGSVATQTTTQDFSAAVSQVLRDDPDGVALLQVGASNVTAMRQLRQAGYSGPVIGNSGAGYGSLKPAGEAGADMYWPSDFHYQQDLPQSKDFVKDYEKKYGEPPLNYSAEAYDAMWFIARALKVADSAERQDIQQAMDTVTSKPWTGALGQGLSWDDHDISVPGVVVRWNGDQEQLLYMGGAE
jgi:branched-chain amino acid transport system substrate-binding protein